MEKKTEKLVIKKDSKGVVYCHYKTKTFRVSELLIGQRPLLLFTMSNYIVCYEFIIEDIIEVDLRRYDITLSVSLLKDYKIPNVFYTVYERTGPNSMTFVGWFKNLHDAEIAYASLISGEINQCSISDYCQYPIKEKEDTVESKD